MKILELIKDDPDQIVFKANSIKEKILFIKIGPTVTTHNPIEISPQRATALRNWLSQWLKDIKQVKSI